MYFEISFRLPKVFVMAFPCLLSFCHPEIGAQNLVPDPGFENYIDCPVTIMEFDAQLVHWEAWSHGPEYFNACNNELTGIAGVPYNLYGFQHALEGNAYAGILTFDLEQNNRREFIAVPLSDPLVPGNAYYVSAYLSKSDSGIFENFHCAVNNFGFRFFKDPFSYTPFLPYTSDNDPDLLFDEVLEDSENWTHFGGWYTAAEAHNWLVLGNFMDDASTEFIPYGEPGKCWGYVYVDFVCVSSSESTCLVSPVSIEEQAKPQVEIFPNPFAKEFYLQGTSEFERIEIYNLSGSLLEVVTLSPGQQTIPAEKFPAGMLVFRFVHRSGAHSIVRAVKQD